MSLMYQALGFQGSSIFHPPNPVFIKVLIELSKTGLSEKKRKQVEEGAEEEGAEEAKDPYLVVHPNYYVE